MIVIRTAFYNGAIERVVLIGGEYYRVNESDYALLLKNVSPEDIGIFPL